MADSRGEQGAGVVSLALAELVKSGALEPDPLQRKAAALLDGIAGEVAARDGGRGFLSAAFRSSRHIAGAYIYGDVGRGKTLLLDLFFNAVPIEPKRRVHFHEFMDEVHEAIGAFRASSRQQGKNPDPIVAVVKPIIASTRLLCLDEFQVNDITNAMLLKRLFEKLYAGGVVVVATSNVEPDRLYENGLNRELFLPFIALLRQNATIFSLDGPTDYRRLKFEGQEVYSFATGDTARQAMDRLWLQLTGGAAGAPAELAVPGRTLKVPRAAADAARFDFAQLCEAPLGARDYLRLAHAYDAIVIDGVPQFDRTRSSAAKRFILLVDTLYDSGVKLGASFAVPLDSLGLDDKTQFEFQRCVSRLIEMQSSDYLNAPRKASAAA
jgi:cell division protein ZapE